MPLLSPDVRRMLDYVRPHAWRLFPVLLLTLLSTALSLVQPWLTRILVDRALVPRDLRALLWVVGLFALLTLVSFAINVVSGLTFTRVSAAILFDMRRDVLRRLQRLSPRWYAAMPIGQIASRINSDVAEIQRVSGEVALAWIGQLIYLVGSVVMLLVLDVRLFAAAMVLLPPALWSLVRYRARLEPAVAAVRDRSAGVGTFLIESLMGMKTLVQLNAQTRTEAGFKLRNDQFVSALLGMRRLTYLSGGLPGVLLAMGGALVFLYGGYRVIAGEITIGTLVAFAAYQVRLLGPVQGLMGIYTSVASARVSLRRVQEILDAPLDVEERPDATAVDRVSGRVSFEGVRYSWRDQPVLDGVSLDVAPGTSVAIVGVSGEGKSTLADLLARQIDPQGGRISLDGRDLRDLTLDSVRRAVHVVEGEPFLFHDTLAANLRLSRPDANDEELRAALHLAGLDALAGREPDGLHTIVGERGRALSSGERQRMALARAILVDPPVLVLDEATGALDPGTEQTLLSDLRPWLSQRTVLLITHRPAVAALASRVVTLRGGRLFEPGVVASAQP